MRTCEMCSEEVEGASATCPHCGTPLSATPLPPVPSPNTRVVPTPAASTVECPMCAEGVDPDARVCPHCGHVLREPAVAPASGPLPRAEVPGTVPPPVRRRVLNFIVPAVLAGVTAVALGYYFYARGNAVPASGATAGTPAATTPAATSAPAAPTTLTPRAAPATRNSASAVPPQLLVPIRVTASSFINNAQDPHLPAHAFDGNPATAWNEGARGPGDGEWLLADFGHPVRVQRVRLATGWDYLSPRNGDLFTGNSHFRRVRLVFSDGSARESEVGAEQRVLVFEGLDAVTSTIRIEAAQVWPGTRWADLCVSEVTVQGQPSVDNGGGSQGAAPDGEHVGCRAAPSQAFHLRPQETPDSTGTEYPAGSAVEILARGTLHRRDSTMYRVRMTSDGATGWVFLSESEIGRCAGPQ